MDYVFHYLQLIQIKKNNQSAQQVKSYKKSAYQSSLVYYE